MDKWTKEDVKPMICYLIFVLIFMLMILGPKPYWLDGGGLIWR